MVDYLVYGKIIVDTIRLLDGSVVEGVLGGGGPQGAFGARIWDKSVGLLTRSGSDLETGCRQILQDLQINLDGWAVYDDIPTPRSVMAYDENEYMQNESQFGIDLEKMKENLETILARSLTLPDSYQNPKVIHLITEYTDEDMVKTALSLKEKGTIFSLEPLIDYHHFSNGNEIISLIPHVHSVTPDWPSASGLAKSDDPLQVVKYWSKLGADLVCIRHGQRGSYAWDKHNDQIWHIPPVMVDVVDPTGAGNSFGGGMSVGWEKHHDALFAGCYGAISASLIIRGAGVPGITQALETEAQKYLPVAIEQSERM